ncbi:hypothetical protein Taro_005334 [Colocasia esculenta]|uniref:Uncharacterized protein n=1 Tax=Colocasia esculenta TaxID=4460 RepID=A0A843TSQ3_COLES|nr:hypothetical protein [Colocasia esculenta]
MDSKCVDTQADCVNTTGFNYSDCFLGQSSSVDTQVDYVDTTGFWDSELVSTHRWTVSTPL